MVFGTAGGAMAGRAMTPGTFAICVPPGEVLEKKGEGGLAGFAATTGAVAELGTVPVVGTRALASLPAEVFAWTFAEFALEFK